ncbi:MAG: VWA domain-containing protein [Armatimonadota bacterium]|nr:VWA domain-containing protein [Armatimonadota bacterium]
MPDALSIRTALDKEFRPLSGDFLQTIMIELTPGRGLSRLPLNLGILLDVSHSMQGTKLENAKQACSLLLNQLSPEDRAAVCVFSSGARTVVPSQVFTGGASEAQRAVSALRVEGATDIMAGLNQVYTEVAPRHSPHVTTFVILLSDGEPTDHEGYIDTDLEKFLRRADDEFKRHGMSLSTIGLGPASDYDASFLRDLADRGSGKFLMAKNPQELVDVFQDEFGRISSTVIADVTLEVTRLNGIARRFWRVVPDKKVFDAPKAVNNSLTIPIGSLQNDQPQAYLLDVVTAPPAENVGRGLLCQVAATATVGGRPVRAEQNVLVSYSDNDVELAQRNNEVTRLIEEANDFKLQVDLENAVKTGDKRKMTSILQTKKKMTQRLGKTTATKVLEEMEDTLASGGDITPDELAVSSVESKKTKRLA